MIKIYLSGKWEMIDPTILGLFEGIVVMSLLATKKVSGSA